MTQRTADASVLVYARIAGVAYLFIIVIGILNSILVDARLIVPGDDHATAANILANELSFRVGTAGTMVMYAAVLALSWALYAVLSGVNKSLALLALLLRAGEAIVGVATVLFGFGAQFLLEGNGRSTVFDAAQLNALVGVFLDIRTAGLDLVLILVGLGGALFSSLFFRSRYVPRALAAWGIFTYVSMVVLAFVSILVPDHPAVLEVVLYGLGAAFEVVFGVWLAVKGVDLHNGSEASGS